MSDDQKPKAAVVSNVPPEIKAAALKAKAELDARDAAPTEPPLPAAQQEHLKIQRVHTILIQKLDRLLRSTGSAECPGCGHDQRFVHPPVQFADEEPEATIQPFAPMPTLLMSTCCRCGLARYHALNAVIQAPSGVPEDFDHDGDTPVPDPAE